MHRGLNCGVIVKRFLKILFKTLLWTTGIAFVVLVVFFGSLFFREQRLPGFAVKYLEDRASTENFLVRVRSANFGMRRGLRLQGVKVYDLRRKDSLENPIATARQILCDCFRGEVTALGLVYERLPDGYYVEGGPPPDGRPIDVTLPTGLDVRIVLEGPSLLGLRPDRITARVRAEGEHRLEIEDFVVRMPDRDRNLSVEASGTVDFESQKVRVRAEGDVRYAHIAPVLDVLDVPVAMPYVLATTEVNDPIPVHATIDADLLTGSFGLDLRFRPPRCRYHGVPVVRSEIGIGVHSENTGTNWLYRFDLDVPCGESTDGRSLVGHLAVDNKAGPARLSFDATSTLASDDLLAIIDAFDRDDFEDIVFDTPPKVSVKGTCMSGEPDFDANDLRGTADFKHGSVMGFRLNDATSEFALKRDVFTDTMSATGKTGGKVDWESKIYFQEFKPDKGHYWASVKYHGGSLEELADAFKFDLGERKGTVDAEFEVSAFLSTNEVASMNGNGYVKVTDGYLAQMKLFAGLTKRLAERVPGVSFLVNQSQASATFTVTDGVFKSDNVFIEGGLVSIKGKGSYDIAADNLDFIVRVQLFKNESLMGKIIHPITAPFTKMLLEFRLTGPIDDPNWQYIPISNMFF